MQETDAQSLLPGGWCLLPAGPYGRKPKLKLTSTLILSLLSQSSTPISEAPVHGEFESVRAQLLEGWDGGWDGTEDFITLHHLPAASIPVLEPLSLNGISTQKVPQGDCGSGRKGVVHPLRSAASVTRRSKAP